jgi:hypothetical protein
VPVPNSLITASIYFQGIGKSNISKQKKVVITYRSHSHNDYGREDPFCLDHCLEHFSISSALSGKELGVYNFLNDWVSKWLWSVVESILVVAYGFFSIILDIVDKPYLVINPTILELSSLEKPPDLISHFYSSEA